MQRHFKLKALKMAAALPCLAAVLLAGFSMPTRGFSAAALPAVDTVASNTSIFVDDPNFGKDPFFPKSGRRVVKVVQPVGAVPNVSAFSQIANGIALKGISGLAGKRLALLNNRTLEVGEHAEFKINNQSVKVRCVEIREKSVVIGLEGTSETKEIHLRAGM